MQQLHPPQFEILQSYIPLLRELQPGYTKQALQRVGVLMLYGVVCIYLMSIGNTEASIRQEGLNSTLRGAPPQPDLIFDLIPPMPQLNHLADYLLFGMLVATFFRFLFHPRGLTAFRRYMAIYSTCTLLRATTVATTTFANPRTPSSFPDDPCGGNYVPPTTAHEFWIASIYPKGMVTCGDLMFSGHSLVFTSLALGWLYYTRTWIEKVLAIAVALVGYFALIALRLHYTDDILVAIYINATLWVLYHCIAMEPHTRKKWRLIRFLEADIIAIEDSHPVRKSNEEAPLIV
eukprot:TRINITY_DN474_c0_g5_i4.p1 TRINITY_DN474_c0_g5~~TRINITY_DN474_c0_g5_i4.p1  ORF type:complete len:290 (+),score=41.42 TRINITY_DN474_c0_g5_i4:337-1206(+)